MQRLFAILAMASTLAFTQSARAVPPSMKTLATSAPATQDANFIVAFPMDAPFLATAL